MSIGPSSLAKASRRSGRTQRTAIMVVGMHRSGTSALTRVLNLLGAALPQHVYGPGIGNETGHWESAEAIRLHDDILQAAGTHWAAIWEPRPNWLSTLPAQTLTTQIKDLVTTEYADHPLFVVKDPRLSLVLPLWNAALDELGIARRTIICFRNPIEVAQSLQERNQTPYDPWHVDRSGFLWLRYVLAAERDSRGQPRAFCDYSELLINWRRTVAGLGATLGISWPRWSAVVENQIDDFLSSSLRHHVATAPAASLGGIWEDWIEPVYQELQKAGAGHEPDLSLLDRTDASYREPVRLLGRYLVAIRDRGIDREGELAGALRKSADLEQQLEQARRDVERLERELTACDLALVASGSTASDLRIKADTANRALAERDQDLAEARRINAERDTAAVSGDTELAASEKVRADLQQQIAVQAEGRDASVNDRARMALQHVAVLAERERELADAREESARNHSLFLETARSLKLCHEELENAREESARNHGLFLETARSLKLCHEELALRSHSTSWRLSYPLRASAARFPRLAGGVHGALRRPWWTRPVQWLRK
jgi:hypothetical protein